MNNNCNNDLSKRYIDALKEKLYQIDDELLSDDVDVLCKYIILRFLKTSPHVTKLSSTEEVISCLEEFVEEIWSFVITFISVVNSSPVIDNDLEA